MFAWSRRPLRSTLEALSSTICGNALISGHGTAASSRSRPSSHAIRPSRCRTISTWRSITASNRARSPTSSRISRSIPDGLTLCRPSRSRKTSLPSAELGSISSLQLHLNFSRLISPPRRNAPPVSSNRLARSLQGSCSSPRMFCSVICGCVRDFAPRDRSLVTVSALIASGQVAQIPYHLNRAMDNGLTRAQASEVIAHLAFYAGWPNAFSAVPVAKGVFDSRSK